ncbi:MAG TPA: TIGR01620 family protein [Xanthobacteraceae bacterium]|jgi:putative membrane protein
MSERSGHRRPEAFRLDDPRVTVRDADDGGSRIARGTIQITPDPDPSLLPVAIEDAILPPKRRSWWGTAFWGAVGGLVLLGTGLGVTHLIEDLFARSKGLGWFGAALALVALLALIVIIGREALGLARLATIEKLHARAAEVIVSDNRTDADSIVRELVKLAHQNPRLAKARATLHSHADDIIDGADMVRLAERELMAPLDAEARRLVSVAAQRVSIVTAISPRALIDVAFVLAAALRLVRQLALLYGGRPGALGMIRLMRHTIAHLAITGGVAASDSLIQQMLGHGVAAKLSHRLGEGILNGLLTARLGLAAIDVTRPLPFNALPRPVLSDLAKDLLRKHDEEA